MLFLELSLSFGMHLSSNCTLTLHAWVVIINWGERSETHTRELILINLLVVYVYICMYVCMCLYIYVMYIPVLVLNSYLMTTFKITFVICTHMWDARYVAHARPTVLALI